MLHFGSLAIAAMLLAGASARAGQVSYDFTVNPTTGANAIEVYPTGFADSNGESIYWKDAGGNPGGFLGITWPLGGSTTIAVFPDIDDGKIVTAFKFECDLRVGNPQQNVRAADGFSINFARANDPVFENHAAGDFATGGAVETGTRTGLAICFDTWSGNDLPDGRDFPDNGSVDDPGGIIVRVDNVTILRQPVPTYNGACDDTDSLQTGPRNLAYWTEAAANGTMPDAAFAPESWADLCWQPLSVEVDAQSRVTVIYKGRTLLDKFQTSFFPSAGGIVLAGRTGGADEHAHFDNLKLTTTATTSDTTPPSVPANLAATTTGARRIVLGWDAATDDSGRVAYQLEKNGTVLPATITSNTYEDREVKPGTAYSYKVRANDVSQNSSAFSAALAVTTVAEVDSPGTLIAQVYRTSGDGSVFSGPGQGDMDTVLGDAKYPNSPDSEFYVNGLQFGEPGFGDTYGENHLVRIATVLTAPETGSFRFFIRSDDASRLYINTAGAAIPDTTGTAVAQEDGCCGPFEEVGAGDNGGTFPTSEPISLTAGNSYGILFLVKEGGGGDWGQVAMRKEGDTRAASSLTAIMGPSLAGKGDPVGAAVTITQQPANATVTAYKSTSFTVAADASSPYGKAPFYQWYKNGVIVPGANAATYSIQVAQPADNAAKIKALVGVNGKSAESAEATLTVTANVAPVISAVSGSDTFTQATVTFDQPVAAPSATTAANYTFDKGLTVTAATLVDQFNVRLTTGTQADNTQYTLSVVNVQNLGGTPIAASTTARFDSWTLVAGRARADQFTGFTGAGLADMDIAVADAKYPNSPDVIRFLNNGLTFGEPGFGDTWGENHLVAMKSILKPTETAQYRFFVRSDDASRLFINTSGAALPDAKTANAIASEAGCCAAFEEVGAGDNGDGTFPTSEPVSLTAGQSYGVLFLVKEGGGGDWGQVAWRKSTDTTPAGTLTPIKDAAYWYGPPPSAAGPSIAIARDAANVKITYTGTLQGSAVVTGPYTDVAGATSPFSAPAGSAAAYWRSRN